MTEIVLKIPKEFEQDFNTDRFKENFERVLFDCKALDYAGISGNYEHETLKMLLDAFSEAVVLPKKHGRIGDLDQLIQTIKELNDDNGGEPLNAVDRGYDLAYQHMVEVAKECVIIETDKEKENESVS